jgi:GNAT superfamily N-acetyltransferase
MNKDKIIAIEKMAARAWRPELEETLDGWRLRYTQGITRRGNSVLAIETGSEMPLAEKLAGVEDFYKGWGEPVCYQNTKAAQPSNLVSTLSSLGYQDDFHTQVQTANLDKILETTEGAASYNTYHEDKLFDSWFDLYSGTWDYSDHSIAMRRGIFSRIIPAANFMLLTDGDAPVAVGLGVADGGWMGVYCMVTQEDYRRQGAATQVLHELAKWGKAQNASQMYLQVMENNPTGLALYDSVGFQFAYQYWYSYPGDER